MEYISNDKPLLDDVGGMLTEPLGNYIKHNLRDLLKYCTDNNILPKNLSETQLKIFEL